MWWLRLASTGKAEAGELGLQIQCQLYSEFKAGVLVKP